MTPLERLIAETIAAEGPLTIDRYMGLCLGHPRYGYYMTRDPLGEKGDFLTAPEISQVFGELIGVWAAELWRMMGGPDPVSIIELGPGRGTLMADMLRTFKRAAPGLAAAARVHLVETSPVLEARQRQLLGAAARWHARLEDVPDGPAIVIANEFFDAIPNRQIERRQGRWHERVVGLADGQLAIGLGAPVAAQGGEDGDIREPAPARGAIAGAIGARLARDGGAALVIDYGHLAGQAGDTLQAMRGHRFVPVTAAPGECDLTSHVDFQALAQALAESGASVCRPLSQRQFLLAMGSEARFAQLAATADAPTRDMLARQQARLAEPSQMGNLFKVLAATAPGLEAPYPFQ
ncbi:MAG: class I SAM-dependent methyltransferase [Aestuariivirga sp.]|uniref:class I SAM-dependent methyltransferase n=1 Tax=Aestuariivirga sp. TaxID=2650926 RepID=UPI0038D1119D